VTADPVRVAVDALLATPVARIGVATGATFTPVYAELVRRQPDWRDVEFVLLDEYVGLHADDPRSFRNTILRELFEPLGIRATQLCGPDTSEPVDVQLLGIGRNGHIGFNEPGSSFASETREVALARDTRDANAGAPARAVTRGIATILRAHRIVLVATGAAKADALANALDGEPDEAVPASALQHHDETLVIADDAAAALLAAR
jgi:glucosamine-6-phosphate deaminase